MDAAMLTFLRRFTTDESGAITLDWVILCAGVAAMAAAIVAQANGAFVRFGDLIATFMTSWTFG